MFTKLQPFPWLKDRFFFLRVPLGSRVFHSLQLKAISHIPLGSPSKAPTDAMKLKSSPVGSPVGARADLRPWTFNPGPGLGVLGRDPERGSDEVYVQG